MGNSTTGQKVSILDQAKGKSITPEPGPIEPSVTILWPVDGRKNKMNGRRNKIGAQRASSWILIDRMRTLLLKILVLSKHVLSNKSEVSKESLKSRILL